MKAKVVGHSNEQGVDREARILKRVARATDEGWEYECDQRHVEIILEQPGVEETSDSKEPHGQQREWEGGAQATTDIS